MAIFNSVVYILLNFVFYVYLQVYFLKMGSWIIFDYFDLFT